MHASVDAPVADDTLNENALPLAMYEPLADRVSVTKNVVTGEAAAVNTNVKLVPPPLSERLGVPDAPEPVV